MVRKHLLVAYFLLAFAFTWGMVGLILRLAASPAAVWRAHRLYRPGPDLDSLAPTGLAANCAASFVMWLGLLSVARFFTIVPLLLLLLAAILIVVFGPNRLGSPADKEVGSALAGRHAVRV